MHIRAKQPASDSRIQLQQAVMLQLRKEDVAPTPCTLSRHSITYTTLP